MDLNEKAWNAALPRGGEPLTPEQEFERIALWWVGEWLRRAKKHTRLSEARPFVLVLSEGPISSPDLDSHLVGKAIDERVLFTFDCPMAIDVVVVTPNLQRAVGYKQGFNVPSDVVQHIKSSGLQNRHLIVIDPGALAYGYRSPADDIEKFEMIAEEPGDEPLQLSVSAIDQHLSFFYEKFVKRPDKFVGVQLWENKKKYALTADPERHLQTVLMRHFISKLPEDSVTTDQEVLVRSGRADIRLMTPSAHGKLRAYWLELKVLRESDGPAGRDGNVRTCIAQARARFEDARAVTEAAFACCYDASKDHAAFDGAVNTYANEDPIVQLRQYAVLNQHYVVKKP